MVWEWRVSTNKATIDGNSNGEKILSKVIVILGLWASLALVNLLGFSGPVVDFVRRAGTFAMGGGARRRCVVLARLCKISDKHEEIHK
jgi:hypothetical protein